MISEKRERERERESRVSDYRRREWWWYRCTYIPLSELLENGKSTPVVGRLDVDKVNQNPVRD